MKNTRMLWAAAFMFVTISCRKNLNETPTSNLHQHIQTANPENLNLLNAKGIIASGWQSSNDWTKVDLPAHSVYYTHLKTAFVNNHSSQQVIRVFKNISGKNIPESLPFEETIDATRYYWYYTITKGSVMIAVDVYGSSTNPGVDNHFKIIVFSPESLTRLQPGELVKTSLSKLSYEKIASILTRWD
jgi:hypothetical protein